MMFTVSVDMSNAAFDEYPRGELARILRNVADSLEHSGADVGRVYDVNGNAVGTWEIGGES